MKSLPSYPARPLNGGPLELAPPKPGQWGYEPKYNGWRALVHAPTGSIRDGPKEA
jgi:ATP-dependent DNA ligase